MSRSKWKGLFQNTFVFNKKLAPKQPLKITSRASAISSKFLKKYVLINTGNNFKKLFVTRRHIGYKFGEFAPTRSIKKK